MGSYTIPAALGRELVERMSAQGGGMGAELVERIRRAGGGIPCTKRVAPMLQMSMFMLSRGVLSVSRSIALPMLIRKRPSSSSSI